ncbi:histidinol dehydrogenase, partial [Ameyamaea chiangmaiensis]
MIRLTTADANFDSAFGALVNGRTSEDISVARPVAEILARIRAEGDVALCDLTNRFDHTAVTPATLRVTDDEIDAACRDVEPSLLEALDLAATRIESFHRAQMPGDLSYTDPQGIRLGMRWTPLDAAGLYVPGGKAAYPSSVLMNAIPARVAGVTRLAMCVPTPHGQLNPLVMAAARRAGVHEV